MVTLYKLLTLVFEMNDKSIRRNCLRIITCKIACRSLYKRKKERKKERKTRKNGIIEG